MLDDRGRSWSTTQAATTTRPSAEPPEESRGRARTYEVMARVRAIESLQSDLWRRGLVSGELHTGIGEEGVAVGVVGQLRDGDALALDPPDPHRRSGAPSRRTRRRPGRGRRRRAPCVGGRRPTGREGVGGGLSGEIAAVLAEEGVGARFARVAVEGTIPFARNREHEALPNVDRIVRAVKTLA